MTTQNWKEKFDKRFKGQIEVIDYVRMILDLDTPSKQVSFGEWMYQRDYDIKAFIQSLLDQRKKEILEKLTLDGESHNTVISEAGERYVHAGYMQAISDLEAKKEELK